MRRQPEPPDSPPEPKTYGFDTPEEAYEHGLQHVVDDDERDQYVNDETLSMNEILETFDELGYLDRPGPEDYLPDRMEE